MINFAKKFALFLIPVILLFVFPMSVFIIGRGYYSSRTALESQMKHPGSLVGFAYSEPGIYKELLVAERNSQIVALGTSRAMQFREEFFSDPDSFSNASSIVTRIPQMEEYIRRLPNDSNTKILILGLDHQMFKAMSSNYETRILKSDSLRIVNMFLEYWRQVYFDYFSGKFTLSELIRKSRESNDIGVYALINKGGFRSDGSYQYGIKTLNNPNQEADLQAVIQGNILSIKKDRSSFLYGKEISQSDIDSLKRLLEICKEKGIYVIGFLPPYPTQIYHELMSVDDAYKKVVVELPKQLEQIFSDEGFGFYDFSLSSILGGSDFEYIDPVHGSDKKYLRIVIYISERDKELKKYVDLRSLYNMLNNEKGNFLNI